MFFLILLLPLRRFTESLQVYECEVKRVAGETTTHQVESLKGRRANQSIIYKSYKILLLKVMLSMKRFYSIVLVAVIFSVLPFTPVSAQRDVSYEVEQPVAPSYKDFRFAIGGGYALRLGKIEKTGDDHWDNTSKKLRHGFTVDADAQYFFREGWGLGLNVNYCSTTISGNDLYFADLGRTANSYKESQNILFVGPSYVGRNQSEKLLLVSSIAIGPLFYMNPATLDGVVIKSNATALGINAGLSGEYKVNATTGVGLKLSYTLGNVNSLKVEGTKVKMEEAFNLSNLMLTAFISFRSW
jgi:hypothetical protein